ncbi:GGDEF domain-containing protein [Piscinibacter sakaiensis]|nr:GGDEF domain-containing protein [Piscinibacter sakaiensis]
MIAAPPPALSLPETLPELLSRGRDALQAQALPQAREAAERAWVLAQAEPIQPVPYGEAGHLLCQCLFRQGALAELIPVAQAVLARLGDAAPWPVRSELLRRLTLAGCELGRHELALRSATECFDLSHARGDDLALSLAHSGLGACFERMGDPWQAERLVSDGLALARGVGDAYVTMVTLNNLCAITIGAFYLLHDGGSDEAEARAALERAEAYAREAQGLLPSFEDPLFRVFVEGNLGEVALHRGRHDEARELLERSLQTAQARGYTAQAWRIRCSLGELLMAEGRPTRARAELDKLLADMGDAAARATLVRTRHALYRACRRLDLPEEALGHLEHYQRLERQRATQQLKAQSSLFITRMEAERSRQEIERARHQAEQERDHAAVLAADALRDPLTGLGNRRRLDRDLPALLAAAIGAGEPLCVAMVDVDHFKPINDRHGHAVGDRVLVALATQLGAGTRQRDLLVRLGGEEFVIVFPQTPLAAATEVCERLRQRVAGHDWAALIPGLSVTLSVGLVQAGEDLREASDGRLLDRADQAMYRAKAAGRNRVVTQAGRA